jgi:hypothetical protein
MPDAEVPTDVMGFQESLTALQKQVSTRNRAGSHGCENDGHSEEADSITLSQLRDRLRQVDDQETAKRRMSNLFDSQALSPREKALLLICLCLHRENRGEGTPVENFFAYFVSHLECESLTPDDIRSYLEDCERHWGELLEISRRLFREHPELVLENAQKE